MKKYIFVSISIVLISIVVYIIITSRSEYVKLDAQIDGFEIYDNREDRITCESYITYTLFSTEEYVYQYNSHGCNMNEFVVKVEDEYILLSEFIEQNNITSDEIEKSGIGSKCYENCFEWVGSIIYLDDFIGNTE